MRWTGLPWVDRETHHAAGEIAVRCCVVGGGPAGMMLGFLLARAGVEVLVLEKHADFLRDFRGDTIHPSTLEVVHELGLLGPFLRLPHQEATQLTAPIGEAAFPIADFRHLLSMLTVSSPKVLDEKSPPDSEVRQSRRVQAAVALGVVPFVAGL